MKKELFTDKYNESSHSLEQKCYREQNERVWSFKSEEQTVICHEI